MSDKIPGSSQSNPIEYRGCSIAISSDPYVVHGYDYVHDSYDPTPEHHGEDAKPVTGLAALCGTESTVQECKDEIDLYYDEHPEDAKKYPKP